MSRGIETVDVAEPWLWSTLSGDPELTGYVGQRIHNAMALGKQGSPYLIYMLQNPRDVTTHNGVIVQVDAIYLVKAVGVGSSYGIVAPAATRIHELLHRPHEVIDVPGGSLTCVREAIVEYPELVDGVQYRHLGGTYRLRIEAS